ncbi:MAG TPA: AMP-binding protein, partial [Polyangiaceae bacterium]|nr:AMP-binding protein [Polyangiaceae bacterium]
MAAIRELFSGARTPSQIYRIHAANSPQRTALVWRDRRLTYAELDARMDRARAGLLRLGVRRGDRVVLMMRNRPEFIEAQLGAGRIGAAVVSASWRSAPPEIAYVLAHSGAKALVFEADLWPNVERATAGTADAGGVRLVAVGGAPPGCKRYEEDLLSGGSSPREDSRRAEQDASVIVYTSGTTGAPKGAVRTFSKESVYAFLHFVAQTPMRADDVHLVACPLYHSTALGFMTMSALLGARIVLMDEFKPEAFLEAIEREGVTTTAVVPTMLHRVLALDPGARARHDLRSLRAVFCGGAPLPGPLALQALDFFGDVLFNFYGATETGLVTLAGPADLRSAPGTIGRPVPGNEVRLLDDSGREVGDGAVGELYVRNEMLIAGYDRDPGATRASMRDGFFSVGDLARRDRRGRYFIEGRKREMILSGGVNVYPAEIEAVLESHPDVAEAAV